MEMNGGPLIRDERLIPAVSIVAYRLGSDEPIAQREALFKWLLELLENAQCPQSEKRRIGALANLGRIYFEQKRFEEAEALYRQAVELSDDNYMSERLALCLYELGRYKEACDLLKPLSNLFFNVQEGEFSDCRDWCERESYLRSN